MQVEEIMKREVSCCSGGETVQVAARKMRDEEVGFIPICDDQGVPVGTLTDRDIVIRACAEALSVETALCADVMTPEVVACRPEDDLSRVEELMSENQVSRVMVCDEDKKLVGVVSLSDIAQLDEGGRASDVLRDVADREVQVQHTPTV
jgi:CBS domain-containing protein